MKQNKNQNFQAMLYLYKREIPNFDSEEIKTEHGSSSLAPLLPPSRPRTGYIFQSSLFVVKPFLTRLPVVGAEDVTGRSSHGIQVKPDH